MANKNFKIFEHWTHAYSHKSHLTIQCHPADAYVTHKQTKIFKILLLGEGFSS